MSRNRLDAYFTPPELTTALVRRLRKTPGWAPKEILTVAEPCAGDGWITHVLTAGGYSVISGDVDPERGTHYRGVNFLGGRALEVYRGVDAIITNPPYTGVAHYVRRALEITPRVAMLLRLSFLEPCDSRPGAARVDLLEKLGRVIVLPRVSFIHGKGGTDSTTCAWFLWGAGPGGPREIEFVTNAELARHRGQLGLFEEAI